MTKFDEVIKEYSERLELYVPVVARVHGGAHPEFYEVQKVYNEMHKKIEDAESDKVLLDEEFKELRSITDNYKTPDDTCESYEAVYNMLSELDQAYNA